MTDRPNTEVAGPPREGGQFIVGTPAPEPPVPVEADEEDEVDE